MEAQRTVYVPLGYENKPGQLVTHFMRNYNVHEIESVMRYNGLNQGVKKSESAAIFAVFVAGLPLKRSLINRAEHLEFSFTSETLLNIARRSGKLEKKNKGCALVMILKAENAKKTIKVKFEGVKDMFAIESQDVDPEGYSVIEEDVIEEDVRITFHREAKAGKQDRDVTSEDENPGPSTRSSTRQAAQNAQLSLENTKSVQEAPITPKAPDAGELLARYPQPSPQQCLEGLEAAREASKRSLQNYEATVRKVSELKDALARAQQESLDWKAKVAKDLQTELLWIEVSEETVDI